jgi:hypothetical protein
VQYPEDTENKASSRLTAKDSRVGVAKGVDMMDASSHDPVEESEANDELIELHEKEAPLEWLLGLYWSLRSANIFDLDKSRYRYGEVGWVVRNLFKSVSTAHC